MAMYGIDAHCHLEFMKEPERVIAEARQKMSGFVTSVAHPEHATEVLEISSRNSDFVFVALGLHPTSALQLSERETEEYISFMRQNRKNIVAVGEIGLDYFHIMDEREKTKQLFSTLIDVANSLKKPIVVHTRNAMPDTLKILESARSGVMMHFFSGSNDELSECIERGYYISYTTITCVSKKYRKLAKKTPLDRILLETDAPWLDPVKKEIVVVKDNDEKKASLHDAFALVNRPWNIALTAEKLEKELSVSKEEILEKTERNARKLFNL